MSVAENRRAVTRLSSFLQNSVVRWILTITWTILTLYLTLSPSGDGTTVTWVSRLFGGTETTDAIGHVIINAILAFLWCWTISLYSTRQKTAQLILIGGIVWCFVAELSQFFVPSRGASLLDLAANMLGVLIGLAIYGQLMDFSAKRKLSAQQ
jgi:VanZ family protein